MVRNEVCKLFWWIVAIVCSISLVGCASMRKRQQEEAEFKRQIEEYNAKVKNPNDKIVCRKITPTGTRIPRRVCRKVREWNKDRDRSQDAMRKLKPMNQADD